MGADVPFLSKYLGPAANAIVNCGILQAAVWSGPHFIAELAVELSARCALEPAMDITFLFPIQRPNKCFGRDVEACSSMCPGSRTELFYHAAGEEDAEQMISYVTDRPYTDLPSAFSYREKVNPGCTCTASTRQLNFSTLAGESDAEREERLEQAKANRIAIPSQKPDFGEDPETLTNRSGNFSINSFAALRQSGSATASAMVSQTNKNIRIVGESFFPTQ